MRLAAPNRITVFENDRRSEALGNFANKYVEYVNGRETDQGLRGDLNILLEDISEIVRQAGCTPIFRHFPPPAIGGYSYSVDLLQNIFRLSQYDTSPQDVVDALHRALGVYERNHRASLIRTFNPFFWLGRLISLIASIPFAFLGSLGLPRQRMEESLLGKLIKGLIELVTFLAGICGILQALGWVEAAMKLLRLK